MERAAPMPVSDIYPIRWVVRAPIVVMRRMPERTRLSTHETKPSSAFILELGGEDCRLRTTFHTQLGQQS